MYNSSNVSYRELLGAGGVDKARRGPGHGSHTLKKTAGSQHYIIIDIIIIIIYGIEIRIARRLTLFIFERFL